MWRVIITVKRDMSNKNQGRSGWTNQLPQSLRLISASSGISRQRTPRNSYGWTSRTRMLSLATSFGRATSSADRGTRLKHQGHPVTEYYQAVSCQYSVSMAWSPSVFTSESLLCAKLRQDVRSKRLDRSVRAILQSRSLYISHAGRPSAWSWPRCSIYPSC
jgi:hypothetical protein